MHFTTHGFQAAGDLGKRGQSHLASDGIRSGRTAMPTLVLALQGMDGSCQGAGHRSPSLWRSRESPSDLSYDGCSGQWHAQEQKSTADEFFSLGCRPARPGGVSHRGGEPLLVWCKWLASGGDSGVTGEPPASSERAGDFTQ